MSCISNKIPKFANNVLDQITAIAMYLRTIRNVLRVWVIWMFFYLPFCESRTDDRKSAEPDIRIAMQIGLCVRGNFCYSVDRCRWTTHTLSVPLHRGSIRDKIQVCSGIQREQRGGGSALYNGIVVQRVSISHAPKRITYFFFNTSNANGWQ